MNVKVVDMRDEPEKKCQDELSRLIEQYKDPQTLARCLGILVKHLHEKSPDDALRSALAIVAFHLRSTNEAAGCALHLLSAHYIAQGDGVAMIEVVDEN